MPLLTEVCVDSLEAVLEARDAFAKAPRESGGAAVASSPAVTRKRVLRLEMCSALHQGGLTPSYGFVQSAVRALASTMSPTTAKEYEPEDAFDTQLFIMLRCRAGLDFEYTSHDLAVMLADLCAFGELKKQLESGKSRSSVSIQGVVFGALMRTAREPAKTPGAKPKIGPATGIDKSAVLEMARAAAQYGLQMTFHRAVDYLGVNAGPGTPAQFAKVLGEIAQTGVSFVLTSGGIFQSAAADGAVQSLAEQAASITSSSHQQKMPVPLGIIVGGGVNEDTIDAVKMAMATAAASRSASSALCALVGVHFSAKSIVCPKGVPESETYWTLDSQKVESLFRRVVGPVAPTSSCL